MKKIKGILYKSIITGISAVCISAPFVLNTTTVSASTGGKTATDAISWVKSKLGKGIDFDGYYGNQCVDLAKAYYSYLGQSQPYGNGSGYTSNSLPKGWSRLKNASPKKGDVLVYTGGYNGYGHVAIYESDYSTYHQNWNSHSYVERVTYKYNASSSIHYWGVIRPDFAPEKTSTPAASKPKTISVTGVSVNKSSITLAPGETATIKATVSPSNAANKKITWSSSDNKVATVDKNGLVRAKKTGTATITVKTADGSKTAKTTVSIKLPSKGLAKVNGVWKYYVNGKVNTKFEGLVKGQSSWFYVRKGKIDLNYTGMGQRPDNKKWYYIKNGIVNLSYTGIAKSPKNGKLYFMRKGKFDPKYNGTVQYNGKTYTVKNGVASLKK